MEGVGYPEDALVRLWPDDGYALVISGSPAGVSAHLLQRLAEKAEYILAADSGADWAFGADIRLDAILGDLDSIDARALAHFKSSGTRIIEFDVHKDDTDIDLAFDQLQGSGYTTVVATNMLGGRIDHILTALGSLARPRGYQPWIIEDDVRMVFLQAAGPVSGIELNRTGQPDTDMFSLVPIGGPAVVSAQGVEWELDDEELCPYGSRGVSNFITADTAVVNVSEGILAVVLLA